jgi:hypothetical protein
MLLNPRYRSFGLFVLPTVLGSGFFSALIMLWLISTYIKTMFNWSIPLIEQPSAISSAAFSLFTPDILLVDSVIIFGFIGLIIWGYFLYKSFQLVHQKIEFRHLVPLAILVGIYPLFIGVTFLASYAAELSARKYKW